MSETQSYKTVELTQQQIEILKFALAARISYCRGQVDGHAARGSECTEAASYWHKELALAEELFGVVLPA